MNVLIIGSGGREHALGYACFKSTLLSNLYFIPGNPGMNEYGLCVDIDPLDNKKIKEFAIDNNIDLVIPGSEVYLENGVTDIFSDTGIKVFGPSKKAAQIESSKEYAKSLMKKHNIPTASYEVFSDFDKAVEYIKGNTPIVIKYDGLAGGKGVVVAMTEQEAIDALDIMLNKKIYGTSNVIIEEYLEGPEFSFMTFVHNNLILPMPIAQDHKRLLEDDKGPNTGGMGIYSSVPIIPNKDIDYAFQHIMLKTVLAMQKENNPFTGFLYGGLINTKNGPKVIEFNARFGDPETEVILLKLKSDFLKIINNLFSHKKTNILWDNEYVLGVVMASKGYPKTYQKGFEITGLDKVEDMVFHMGTKEINQSLVTNGGRVLLVTGKGKTLKEAKEKAYHNVSKIKCENLIYRTDIGYKAL